MAIVERGFFNVGFNENQAKDEVGNSLNLVRVRPRLIVVTYDDQEYPGIDDAVTEFMATQGFAGVISDPSTEAPINVEAREVSISSTLNVSDELVVATGAGAIVLTMPENAPFGKKVRLLNRDNPDVTLLPPPGQTINGAANINLLPGASFELSFDEPASNWAVI